MSTIKANTISPAEQTHDITLGASGDTISVAGNDLRVNTIKDKGGNTLWISDGSGTLSNQNKQLARSNRKLLSTNSVTNQAAVAFTSNIDSTYDVYIIEFRNINPATDSASFTFQLGSGGGPTYGKSIISTLVQSFALVDNTTHTVQRQDGDDQVSGTGYVNLTSPNLGNESDRGGGGHFYLFKPSSSSTIICYQCETSWFNNDGASEFFAGGYVIGTVGPVTAINFKMSSGNLSGIFKLYGLL